MSLQTYKKRRVFSRLQALIKSSEPFFIYGIRLAYALRGLRSESQHTKKVFTHPKTFEILNPCCNHPFHLSCLPSAYNSVSPSVFSLPVYHTGKPNISQHFTSEVKKLCKACACRVAQSARLNGPYDLYFYGSCLYLHR